MNQAKTPPAWIDAAGALYLEAVRHADKRSTGLDAVTSRFLRAHASLGDEGRAFVVGAAQDMMRARRRLEAAVQQLGYAPTRAGIVCLWLVGARQADPRTLPIDPRGASDLERAWLSTDALPIHVRASMPEWLVEELRSQRSDADALCLAMTQRPPMTLRTNTLRSSRDALIVALEREALRGAPGRLAPDAIVLETRRNVFRTQAFRDGLFEVQDEGSQLVSLMCGVEPGMVVVDGCAGAGGKTLHLAALMEGRGTLHAFDIATHRLDALRDRARRAGAHNIRVHSLEDARPRKRLAGTADVVLVDAPCSGTGVLRRNPDTSWRLASEDVERMRKQQRAILEAYAPLVRPGGRLVYATCSVLERENNELVEDFLQAHAAFTRAPALALLERHASIPSSDPTDDGALHVDPLRHGTDGFFACTLVRAT